MNRRGLLRLFGLAPAAMPMMAATAAKEIIFTQAGPDISCKSIGALRIALQCDTTLIERQLTAVTEMANDPKIKKFIRDACKISPLSVEAQMREHDLFDMEIAA